jgi:hypothetical protein
MTANGSWPISGSIYSRGSTAAGDAGSVTASPTDRTADTSLLTMTNGGASLGYWPVVMGRSKGLNRAMIAVVDSIGSGAHDNTPAAPVASATGLDRLGFPERTWGDDGIIILGVGGMAVSDLVTPAATAAGGSKMAQVQKYAAGATGAFFEIGTNDIAGYPGTSIATLQARLIKLWQRVSGDRGIPGWQQTFLPRPASSTDSWLTVANQTLGTLEPGRLAINAWLRDGAPWTSRPRPTPRPRSAPPARTSCAAATPRRSGGVWTASVGSSSHPLRGVIELADIVESARDSGKWKTAAWLGSGTTTNGSNHDHRRHDDLRGVLQRRRVGQPVPDRGAGHPGQHDRHALRRHDHAQPERERVGDGHDRPAVHRRRHAPADARPPAAAVHAADRLAVRAQHRPRLHERMSLSAWTNQSAPTDARGQRAREDDFNARTCLILACHAEDVAPKTPNSNPRAQLVSDKIIVAGGEYRATVDMLVPCGAIPYGLPAGWVEFVQWSYGAPFAGSPPLRMMTLDGKTFGLREADGPFPWTSPLWRDMWWRMVMEWRHGTDGWYRFTVNGQVVVPQTPYATVQACNAQGPDGLILNAYMAAGTADRIGPVYFANAALTRTN